MSVDELPGILHAPEGAAVGALVLTHGAGGSRDTPLLCALADRLAGEGVAVLRCNLAFRALRPKGPPRPGDAARDRAGLKEAALALRRRVPGRMVLGGHSYGGRQSSMLLADEPELADGLLLLSYPLHPPGRPAELRTAHLPRLKTKTLLVSGTADPFGTPEELERARALVPAPTTLVLREGAGHDLLARRNPAEVAAAAQEIARAARSFLFA